MAPCDATCLGGLPCVLDSDYLLEEWCRSYLSLWGSSSSLVLPHSLMPGLTIGLVCPTGVVLGPGFSGWLKATVPC